MTTRLDGTCLRHKCGRPATESIVTIAGPMEGGVLDQCPEHTAELADRLNAEGLLVWPPSMEVAG